MEEDQLLNSPQIYVPSDEDDGSFDGLDNDSVFDASILNEPSTYGAPGEECKFIDTDLQEKNVTMNIPEQVKVNKAENYIRGHMVPTVETYLAKDKELPKGYIKPKFLSRNCFEKVAIASYQDSGSELLRKYIENTTYILTGSDRDTKTVLGKQYQCDQGFEGEGVAGKKVWMVKTSFPEEIGEKKIGALKAILVTQNPCDAIYNHFCTVVTKKIDQKLDDEKMKVLNN